MKKNKIIRLGWSLGVPFILAVFSALLNLLKVIESDIFIIIFVALVTFVVVSVIAELIQHILREQIFAEEIKINHNVNKKLLDYFNQTQNEGHIEKIVSSFDGISQIYPKLQLNELQKKFLDEIIIRKYDTLLKQCFNVDIDHSIIKDTPGYYFVNQENADTNDSLWGFLIKKVEKYLSMQVFNAIDPPKNQADIVYEQSRLDGERQIIKGKILSRNFKEFRKIIVFPSKYKICLDTDIKQITKECLSGACGGWCIGDYYKKYVLKWFEMKDEVIRENCIDSESIDVIFTFEDIVNGLFDGCPVQDFGIFGEQILGIQRVITNPTNPFKSNVACDFYFDKSDMNDYVKKFNSILKHLKK